MPFLLITKKIEKKDKSERKISGILKRLKETKKDKMFQKKIVITGPESTGKSTLAKALAKKYGCSLVDEYARTYLSDNNKPYGLDDVLVMAKEQLKREVAVKNQLVILDTDLTVFAIWIKEKYHLEIDWINQQLSQSTNKIYFLCDTTIEWEEDALREHPKEEDRKRLFELYKILLEKYGLTYYIITGSVSSRVQKCQQIITDFYSEA